MRGSGASVGNSDGTARRAGQPYWHLTLNTADKQLVDHTVAGWQCGDWTTLKESVVSALGDSKGLIRLPGRILAMVSSCSGSDGQMSFDLILPGRLLGATSVIHGSYCADRAVEEWQWGLLLQEHYGKAHPDMPLPVEDGRPWLAVGFHNPILMALVGQVLPTPFTWCSYEQLLADAWQMMPPEAKAGLRRRMAAQGDDFMVDPSADLPDVNARWRMFR